MGRQMQSHIFKTGMCPTTIYHLELTGLEVKGTEAWLRRQNHGLVCSSQSC